MTGWLLAAAAHGTSWPTAAVEIAGIVTVGVVVCVVGWAIFKP